jgi:hypothetical protein
MRRYLHSPAQPRTVPDVEQPRDREVASGQRDYRTAGRAAPTVVTNRAREAEKISSANQQPLRPPSSSPTLNLSMNPEWPNELCAGWASPTSTSSGGVEKSIALQSS